MTNDTHTAASIPDEWLSAYLDGELAPAEIAQFEEALKESADLQRQLDDFRGMSELLKSLPQPKLQDDFAQRLPIGTVAAAAKRPRWRSGWTASSLVAASLLVGVLWFQSTQLRGPTFETDRSIATAGEAAPESAARVGLLADSSGDHAIAQPNSVAFGPASTNETRERLEDAMAGREMVESAPSVRPGELISLLETVNGEVAVVEWAVLDVNKALDDLQVTLTRLGVATTVETTSVPDAGGDELFAVYVQGNEDVMQAVVAQTQMLQQQRQPRARMAVPSSPKPSLVPQSANVAAAADGVETESIASPREMAVAETKQPTRVGEPVQKSTGPTFDLVSPARRATAPDSAPTSAEELQLGNSSDDRNQANDWFGRDAAEFAYQVPLQMKQESVDRILLNNTLTQAETSNRVLVVFKPVKPPADESQ